MTMKKRRICGILTGDVTTGPVGKSLRPHQTEQGTISQIEFYNEKSGFEGHITRRVTVHARDEVRLG
jgi:hypothetical protein